MKFFFSESYQDASPKPPTSNTSKYSCSHNSSKNESRAKLKKYRHQVSSFNGQIDPSKECPSNQASSKKLNSSNKNLVIDVTEKPREKSKSQFRNSKGMNAHLLHKETNKERTSSSKKNYYSMKQKKKDLI
mmetsp:Transcript_1144/g.1148  ORF Transcript_1144/g.1148 Transcript_1144/m.1148 type:complete len:131 (+) Transcript_1144:2472-2864(+)|eukprot:CAMPEP_0170558610 /NCGR_PEP_ID=MMETSP0211-20121228/36389_1 /TAXON_ID=311385 /ORGANISM="Pseudokeronopsis sp., Strain OXSARD2" /LENGTH=130 /DNA_ID=CAMNT_0010870705 /DNA_START=2190 /DNA_END=2582 /DNA_ORIENTATION=+